MSYKSFVPVVVNDDFKVSPKQVKKGAVDETSDRDVAVQSLISVISQVKMIDKAMVDILNNYRFHGFETVRSDFNSVIFHSVCPYMFLSKEHDKETMVIHEKRFASINAVWKQIITVSEALTYLHQKSSTSSGGRMNGASDEGWLSSSRKADIFLSIY
jgi:hypothetical protein